MYYRIEVQDHPAGVSGTTRLADVWHDEARRLFRQCRKLADDCVQEMAIVIDRETKRPLLLYMMTDAVPWWSAARASGPTVHTVIALGGGGATNE